ncbi:uncharacterized protein VTP21DRAFT_5886 [Calcarisporiella thermophila]|uniref:uncharacterized protein n=1 Tax=Calcarisporiella thermophila TaxID=911321 RepID=UPI00374451D6
MSDEYLTKASKIRNKLSPLSHSFNNIATSQKHSKSPSKSLRRPVPPADTNLLSPTQTNMPSGYFDSQTSLDDKRRNSKSTPLSPGGSSVSLAHSTTSPNRVSFDLTLSHSGDHDDGTVSSDCTEEDFVIPRDHRVAKEGWIWKKSSLKQWKRYYAVACFGDTSKPGRLLLYKDAGKQVHRKTVDMSDCVEIEPRHQEYKPGIRHEFRMLVRKEDIWLGTEDINDRRNWIDALSSLMPRISSASHLELQTRMEMLENSNRSLQSAQVELEEENQALREELVGIQEELAEREEEVNQLAHELENTKLEVRQREEEISTLRRDYEDRAEEERRALQEQISGLEAQVEKWQAAAREADDHGREQVSRLQRQVEQELKLRAWAKVCPPSEEERKASEDIRQKMEATVKEVNEILARHTQALRHEVANKGNWGVKEFRTIFYDLVVAIDQKMAQLKQQIADVKISQGTNVAEGPSKVLEEFTTSLQTVVDTTKSQEEILCKFETRINELFDKTVIPALTSVEQCLSTGSEPNLLPEKGDESGDIKQKNRSFASLIHTLNESMLESRNEFTALREDMRRLLQGDNKSEEASTSNDESVRQNGGLLCIVHEIATKLEASASEWRAVRSDADESIKELRLLREELTKQFKEGQQQSSDAIKMLQSAVDDVRGHLEPNDAENDDNTTEKVTQMGEGEPTAALRNTLHEKLNALVDWMQLINTSQCRLMSLYDEQLHNQKNEAGNDSEKNIADLQYPVKELVQSLDMRLNEQTEAMRELVIHLAELADTPHPAVLEGKETQELLKQVNSEIEQLSIKVAQSAKEVEEKLTCQFERIINESSAVFKASTVPASSDLADPSMKDQLERKLTDAVIGVRRKLAEQFGQDKIEAKLEKLINIVLSLQTEQREFADRALSPKANASIQDMRSIGRDGTNENNVSDKLEELLRRIIMLEKNLSGQANRNHARSSHPGDADLTDYASPMQPPEKYLNSNPILSELLDIVQNIQQEQTELLSRQTRFYDSSSQTFKQLIQDGLDRMAEQHTELLTHIAESLEQQFKNSSASSHTADNNSALNSKQQQQQHERIIAEMHRCVDAFREDFQLSRAHEAPNALKLKIQRLNAEVRDLEQVKRDLASQLEELSTQIAQAESGLKSVQSQSTYFVKLQAELGARKTAIEHEVEKLESQEEKLRLQKNEMKAEIVKLEKQVIELQSEALAKERVLAGLKAQLEAYSTIIEKHGNPSRGSNEQVPRYITASESDGKYGNGLSRSPIDTGLRPFNDTLHDQNPSNDLQKVEQRVLPKRNNNMPSMTEKWNGTISSTHSSISSRSGDDSFGGYSRGQRKSSLQNLLINLAGRKANFESTESESGRVRPGSALGVGGGLVGRMQNGRDGVA